MKNENKPERKFDLLKEDQIKKWIENGIDHEAIQFCNEFGKEIAVGKFTTSQIRIFYGEMRRIELAINNNDQNDNDKNDNDKVLKDKEKTAFLMLKPRLAYAEKRNNTVGMQQFRSFFNIAYKYIFNKNSDIPLIYFKNFMYLMEGILAYHKFYEN